MSEMKVKLDEGAILPTRAHDIDGGLDLYSMEDKVIPAGGSAVFNTGVHLDLPTFTYVENASEVDERERRYIKVTTNTVPTAGIIISKSGLNMKRNITSTGLIDMGYTGPIVVKLYNHGQDDQYIHRGDKISQLVVVPVLTPKPIVVDELDETERGDNGFGSSGR